MAFLCLPQRVSAPIWESSNDTKAALRTGPGTARTEMAKALALSQAAAGALQAMPGERKRKRVSCCNRKMVLES